MTAALLLAALAPGADPGVTLPAGFSATVYSGPELANDITVMTVDDRGRVLVAGPGYVRVLADDDGDGRADRAVPILGGFREAPMGLLAEGEDLYVVARGGLKCHAGYNGRDLLTGSPHKLLSVKTGGEHDAHAVRRGPDGWLYLLLGNMAGLDPKVIDRRRSPVADPVAGCLVRIRPDEESVEVVADGFRNAYGFDFDPAGEPFTFDSDNERCVGLPWYEGCRFYHVVPGGNYGWRSPQLSQTWRKPPYFADVVPPVADLGRGSPTGVACYRHAHFPARYRGGFFLADWTFGRIHFVPLTPSGATVTGKPEVFLEPAAGSGFAPTALAVHPTTGELFVSIGGRGTRGGVYRIRYDVGGDPKLGADPRPGGGAGTPGGRGRVLGAPVSGGHRGIEDSAPATRKTEVTGSTPHFRRSLDWSPSEAEVWLLEAVGGNPAERRRALELIARWRERFGFGPRLFEAVIPNLDHPDPLVRAAAARAASAAAVPTGRARIDRARLALALVEARTEPAQALNVAAGVLGRSADRDDQLAAVRLVQLGLGDLTATDAVGTAWEGYTLRGPMAPNDRERALEAVRHVKLPTGRANLDREVIRTLGALGGLGQGSVTGRALLFPPDATVGDDLHTLFALARDGELARAAAAEALVRLDRKARKARVPWDRNWPLRIDEMAAALLRHPSARAAVIGSAEFGRPEHAALVRHLRLPPVEAARRFVAAAKADPDYEWTPGVVALLAAPAPYESRPLLLKLWDRGGVDDAVLKVLSAAPEPADIPKFVRGLGSTDTETVRASAAALAKLPGPEDWSDVVAAVRVYSRQDSARKVVPAGDPLAVLIQQRLGLTEPPDPRTAVREARSRRPPGVKLDLGGGGFDAVAWAKREATIPWAAGDAGKGRAAFVKATCAACHDGGGAVGPSLAGVGKRFGRDDLIAAVVDPSRDVPDRYRPTQFTTADGTAVVGMIVYEAADGVIVQTGPDATVRVAGDRIEGKRLLTTSLMPTGLLDRLSNQEVADLFAYLAVGDRGK